MLFEVKNLTGGYGKNIVVDDVSFSVSQGDMVYVLGANGSGKTTMFEMIIGYKNKMSGNVLMDSLSTDTMSKTELAKHIAYIPQIHTQTFGYLVRDMVLMGRTCHIPRFSTPSTKDYEIVDETLEMLNIQKLADREYTELSGGERQLVLIARAICQKAKIIIMDEPLNNLDFTNKKMLTETLNNLVDMGYTVIMSTHSVINNYKDNSKILLMDEKGHATFGAIEDIISGDLLKTAYGVPLQIICTTDEKGGKHLLCLPL